MKVVAQRRRAQVEMVVFVSPDGEAVLLPTIRFIRTETLRLGLIVVERVVEVEIVLPEERITSHFGEAPFESIDDLLDVVCVEARSTLVE